MAKEVNREIDTILRASDSEVEEVLRSQGVDPTNISSRMIHSLNEKLAAAGQPTLTQSPGCPFCGGDDISPNTNFRGDKDKHSYQCNTCSHTF